MKQARAFGVGVVVATQIPMDLDYRALSNAGLWCIGRLQTDADRARVIEGLSSNDRESDARLNETVRRIAPRGSSCATYTRATSLCYSSRAMR
jgi:DNA helicase HerA-like ATPase